jgi:hypothetical protein
MLSAGEASRPRIRTAVFAGPSRCRRRDSNPRHADYDSSRAVAWGVVRARKRRQMGVFASSGPGVVALNGVGGVCTLFAPSTDRCSRWRRALSRSTVGRSIPNDVVPFTRERSRVAVLSRCCFRGSKLQRRVARSGVRLMRKLRGSFPLDAWQKYPAALVGPGGVACYQEGSRLAPGWTAIAWRAFYPRGS